MDGLNQIIRTDVLTRMDNFALTMQEVKSQKALASNLLDQMYGKTTTIELIP